MKKTKLIILKIFIFLGFSTLYGQRGSDFSVQENYPTPTVDSFIGIFDSNLAPPGKFSIDILPPWTVDYGVTQNLSIGIQGWSLFLAAMLGKEYPIPIVGKLRYRFFDNKQVRSAFTFQGGIGAVRDFTQTVYLTEFANNTTYRLNQHFTLESQLMIIDFTLKDDLAGNGIFQSFFAGAGASFLISQNSRLMLNYLIPLYFLLDVDMTAVSLSAEMTNITGMHQIFAGIDWVLGSWLFAPKVIFSVSDLKSGAAAYLLSIVYGDR